MKRLYISALLILTVLFTGCTTSEKVSSKRNDFELPYVVESESSGSEDTLIDSAAETIPIDSVFSDRDRSGAYEENDAETITLANTSITSSSETVAVHGSTAVISKDGTYIVSGILENGSLIVDASKEDKIQIVLDNAVIHSDISAPIYIKQADKVFITLAPESENKLSNGGTFADPDNASIDAVIFSKDDLTINGCGKLDINSPAGHGVVSKDELTVCGGSIEIASEYHGLSGKDSISITGTTLHISSGKDGIHSENKDNSTLGYLYIEDGTFTIQAEGDCISSAAALQIDDGSFDLIAGGGSIYAEKKQSDGFGMGGRVPPDGTGGMPPNPGRGMMAILPVTLDNTANTESESTSKKGMKSNGILSIYDGSFTVNSADDAVHSNKDIQVYGGSFSINSGDDAFHADSALKIENGTIGIKKSYEGLEALSICIKGGNIDIAASDDGMNAAGGTDQSGFGGMHGRDMFAADPNSYIEISGGIIQIKALGDGIDSNGALTINGGNITLCGPTTGDTAVLDYTSTGVISGGTFIGTGSSMMAQTLSSETQGIIALNVGMQKANTSVSIFDTEGKEVLSVTPEMDFSIVLLSCPSMEKGEAYIVTIGSVSKQFEAQ